VGQTNTDYQGVNGQAAGDRLDVVRIERMSSKGEFKMLSPVHQYAWDKFWDYEDENDETALWAAAKDEEDRRILEWEIEAMVKDSIPKNQDALRHAYAACDWGTVPENATCDLHTAVFTTVIEDGKLEAEGVFARLRPPCITELGEQPPARPEVVLSFPRQYLDIFILCLDHYAARTIQEFQTGYFYFLDSLPGSVRRTLEFCFLDLVVPTLMDMLQEQ